jgi:dTDP-4-dehydrorhamnose reductase
VRGVARARLETPGLWAAPTWTFSTYRVEAFLSRAQADVVFNTVAYTKVDQAEDEPAEATRLNAQLPLTLGKAALATGVGPGSLQHGFRFSTARRPRLTRSKIRRSALVYGQTKFQGERELLSLNLPKLLIIRTSLFF